MRILKAALVVLAVTAISTGAQEFHYWGEELQPVFAVLQGVPSPTSISIELSGRCNPTGLPGFPRFRGPFASVSPLAALREVAASAHGMTVEESTNRRIRMTEAGVPDDLRNVRIKHLVFENYAHHAIHSATFAAEVILSSPEVRSFMEAHNVAAPQLNGPGGITGNSSDDDWPSNAPHISGSVEDVTVSEAWDRVLAAFPGEVLVYWNCPDMLYGSEPVTKTPSTEALEHPHAVPPNYPTREGASYQKRIYVFFFRTWGGFGGKVSVGYVTVPSARWLA